MLTFPALTYGCKVFIKDTVWLKYGSMDLSMNLAIKSLFQFSFFKVNLRNSEYIFFTLECAVLRGRIFPPNLKGQQPKIIIKHVVVSVIFHSLVTSLIPWELRDKIFFWEH